MAKGVLIEFGGLPGTGKSTLAGRVARRTGAVWLRIDEIEAAMRRNGLTAEQTGVTAYSVAHDVAASHLRRGLTVIADAVNPVAAARQGWRDLAAESGARHVIVETTCPDTAEHERRVTGRPADIPGWRYPTWAEVRTAAAGYEPRAEQRLTVDTTRPVAECERLVLRHIAVSGPGRPGAG